MNNNSLLTLVLLAVAGVIFYPKIAPFLEKENVPAVTPNTPAIQPDASLQPVALPLTTALQGNRSIALDFADFYTDFRDSLQRDSEGLVYPTTEHFKKVNETALRSAFQGKPTHQQFNVGPIIDDVYTKALGGKESKSITSTERASLVRALDTIIWTLQQVK